MDLTPARPARPSPAALYLASLAPGGRPAVRYQLRQVARLLTGRPDPEAIPWARLDRAVVIGIVEHLRQRGMAVSTINHCLSILTRVAEEAWHEGLLDVETYQRIAKVRREPGQRLPVGHPPSRETLRAALEAARAGPTLRHLRDATLLAVMAGAGLRAAELRALTHADVTPGHLVVRGKGNKHVRQPLAPAAEALLDEYQDALPTLGGPLFPRWRRHDCPGTTALSASGLATIVTAWLPGHSPHDLRRAYATWLAADGHSLAVIQRLMRHANPATTMRYIRNEADLLGASQALHF